MRGLPAAGAAVRGLDLAGKGKGGVLTGRRNSALRQEARFLLVTADLRAAQLRPWSGQGLRGVQTARARARARPRHNWAASVGVAFGLIYTTLATAIRCL